MKFKIVLSILMVTLIPTVFAMAARWQDTILADNLSDALTPDERQELIRRLMSGELSPEWLSEINERFWRAPHREGALELAFRTDFSANASRELGAIRDAFIDPGFAIKVLQRHYQRKGTILGTLDIVISLIIAPLQSWWTILF